MTKLNVMTIVGTRPEIIRLSECIKACDNAFNHILVHTGQNWDYTLNKIFFEDLEVREPDYYLEAAGRTLGETMGNIISYSYKLLQMVKPDALLVLGDTNSCLAAISAKRLKIPIFHMEAGNRCFDQNVPEETNRRIVDHISDVNLPYTEHSRHYLISEGIKKEYIFVTGSPMAEVVYKNMEKINQSQILDELELKKNAYFVVSAHREENIEDNDSFFTLMNSLNHIAEKYNMPLVYSTHPRSWQKIQQHNFEFHPLIKKLKPFGFFNYNHLQLNSYCVLSDSGTLSEESALLGFPAVLIRTSTERPEAIDKGTIVLGGIKAYEIEQAIELCRNMVYSGEKLVLPSNYLDTNVSNKVVKIIQSYTKIVNKYIWNKK